MVVIRNWRLRNRALEFFMRMESILLLSMLGEVKTASVRCIFEVRAFFSRVYERVRNVVFVLARHICTTCGKTR